MKKKITLKTIFSNLDAIITGTTLTICVILVNANVIMRYFFNNPIHWSEEIVTSLFVWTVFIGSSYAYRKHSHLGVDIVVNMLPPALKRAIATLMDIILVVLNAYMFYLSVVFISKSYTKLTPVMGVSSAYITAAVVIAFFMMTIYSVVFVYEDFCGKKEGNA